MLLLRFVMVLIPILMMTMMMMQMHILSTGGRGEAVVIVPQRMPIGGI